MEQKEPIKIESRVVIRWIMEFFLVVLALGTITGYASAVDNGFVNYDWRLEMIDHIGQFDTAPQDSEFVVATLYLQNYSNGVTVAPDPGSWILVADNVTYSAVLGSYNNAMGYSNMPIPYGGDVETKVVYQVPRNTKYGYIKHNGPFTWDPIFIYINHYTLSQSSNSDESIKAFDKAIELNPRDSLAWDAKGLALYKLNKYDEAITAYNKAIKINPQYSYAWDDKGEALVKLGKSDKAITAYDKALEINPQDPLALEGKEALSKNFK